MDVYAILVYINKRMNGPTMKKISMIICFLLFASTAIAEDGIIINLGSKHFASFDGGYNEKNYGVGYTSYSEDNTAWQIGVYDNSFSNWSVYAAYKSYGYDTASSIVNPFYMIGVVTGYTRLPITPILALGVDVAVTKTHKLNFMIAPHVDRVAMYGTDDYQMDYSIVAGVQYEKLF